MSLPGPPGADDGGVGEGGPQRPDPEGMRPTPVGVVVGWALAGLLLGRLARPLAEWLSGTAPVVTWTQPLALLAVAAVLGATARATHRSVHELHEPLPAHRAVNRLLVARASILAAALVGGGYGGYAVAWFGSDAFLADQRIVRSLLAAAAAAAAVVAAVLLERACRVPSDDAES